MEIVNRRFKEFRELLRLSEEEFAEKTGIKPDRIKKIEDGCTKVRLEEVLAVSDCFGLSNDYLLGIEEQPRPILLWSSIFVTLVAKKILLLFGIASFPVMMQYVPDKVYGIRYSYADGYDCS